MQSNTGTSETGSPETRALLARCARIGTATWADAFDAFGLDGIVSGLPQRSGTGRCAGFAVTVRAEVAPLGGFDVQEFGQDRMIDAAGPGQVLVVSAGGVEISCMGGIVGLSASKKGIEGVVIDGGCRDVDDLRKAGLWVASRHVTPRTGKRRLRLGSFGAPVLLGGVRVAGGDLVVGDATGLVVVPRERLEEVLAVAERVLGKDTRMEQSVAAGQSLAEAGRS